MTNSEIKNSVLTAIFNIEASEPDESFHSDILMWLSYNMPTYNDFETPEKQVQFKTVF